MSRPSTNTRRYRACLDGLEPAEVLPTGERALLVRELHKRGWTDAEVAAHTRMSTYTAARIRQRIGLPMNFEQWQKGAV